MHARCSQYKLKLRELAQELEEAESRTSSVQEIADLRADEVRPYWQAFTLHAVLQAWIHAMYNIRYASGVLCALTLHAVWFTCMCLVHSARSAKSCNSLGSLMHACLPCSISSGFTPGTGACRTLCMSSWEGGQCKFRTRSGHA